MVARALKDVLETYDQSFRKLISLLSEISLFIMREIPHALKTTKGVNLYGEKQTQIDVWSNELLVRKLVGSGLVKQIASEEMGMPIETGHGEYSVVLDPLDGSSNVKSDNLMGTIVGIYHEKPLPAKGRDLFASLCFLYGPYLQAVLGVQEGVYIFVAVGKEPASERFLSDGEPHQLPQQGNVYGIGGSRDKWIQAVREFAELLEERGFKLRYGGSLVGDYNQVLHNGGFFAYPELIDAPQGKYRLQFESNPIAFITEKAGGEASMGSGPILDVEPISMEQLIPTYLGNADLVLEFEEVVKRTKHRGVGPR